MVPKLYRAGRSFKGLARYLTHDPGAETTARVAWTHTRNCAFDDVPSAVHEMVSTWRDADLLKAEAGIRRGGRALGNPVSRAPRLPRRGSPTRRAVMGVILRRGSGRC